MNYGIKRMIAALLVAAGMWAGGAAAQPYQVNISGATLFQNFFQAFASTNDWIDVDGDGNWGYNPNSFIVDQLAKTWPTAGSYFTVTYRAMGSGNGLAELVSYYNAAPPVSLVVPPEGIINRVFWATGGLPVGGIAVPGNPGQCPIVPDRIDMAVMDVPTTWFTYVGTANDAAWNKTPVITGYGRNPLKSWNANQSNQLKSLGGLNVNVGAPDNQTIFDTQVAYVPVAIIANAGVSAEPNITQHELQYLFLTGRSEAGENLAVATRDSGSGTRNAAMNSLGIDPSWARGDNLNLKTTLTDPGNLGRNHQNTNMGESGGIEQALRSRRLGIGYTGLAGSSRAEGDSAAGQYEILNVQMDGASLAVRPTLNAVLHNGDPNTGYRIGGSETFATVGDPNLNTSNPHMINSYAAQYLNNITESIRDFINPSKPGDANNMPGQYLATKFWLNASIDQLSDPLFPTQYGPNPGFLQSLQDYVVANSTVNIYPFNSRANGCGLCPIRMAFAAGDPNRYSDGSQDGSYTDAGGNQVVSGTVLAERNKIAGDFNYAGAEKHQRNMNDIAKMMEAIHNPDAFEANVDHGGNAGGQWGDYVIVEVVGDFNGDGNFDANDIRYFADGLAIDTVSSKLDRSSGFAAVDSSWTYTDDANHPAGNYFNTMLATGRVYDPNSGWSKADVAGKAGVNVQPGANPAAADKRIDAKDIDWIHNVLRGGIRATALGLPANAPAVNPTLRKTTTLDWTVMSDAVWMDLSGDMNNDQKVSGADVRVVVYDILGTTYGDVNLDGKADATDRAIIVANISATYGKSFAEGDIDGDGYVTQNDADLFDRLTADVNHDLKVDILDLAVVAERWLENGCVAPSYCGGADADHSGSVDVGDFAVLAMYWNADLY